MRVCATLDVPFITLDCVNEYKKEVVDYMIREYSLGRVPNPDIFCNKYVKFGVFLKKALEMGADFVATGHYARIQKNKDGYVLMEGLDKNKDQSYFLYTLTQEQLEHIIFPIGDLTKPEVRKLAEKYKLPTANKKDSQGLCFIGKVDMKEFLSHFIETKEGNVLDTKGEVIGYHPGALLFTLGQRHGFTVVKKSTNEPRLFVVSKDLNKNTITVASKISEDTDIFKAKEVLLKDLNFDLDYLNKEISVRFRYRQEKKGCLVEKRGDDYFLVFKKREESVSIGQSAVFYKDEVCLGGGIIEQVF